MCTHRCVWTAGVVACCTNGGLGVFTGFAECQGRLICLNLVKIQGYPVDPLALTDFLTKEVCLRLVKEGCPAD